MVVTIASYMIEQNNKTVFPLKLPVQLFLPARVRIIIYLFIYSYWIFMLGSNNDNDNDLNDNHNNNIHSSV